MNILSNVTNKLKKLWVKVASPATDLPSKQSYETLIMQANDRITRMERNYLVLLKRLLEMDGIKLVPKSTAMSSKVMQVTTEEQQGLNERKPTLH